MLGVSPMFGAEEWAIHDYEGFQGLEISEYEDIQQVAAVARYIQQHGQAWALYAEYLGIDFAKESFQEAYAGEWESEEDFAEQLALETMNIPDHLQIYMDYEKFARDLFINDYFSAQSEGRRVHVYRHL